MLPREIGKVLPGALYKGAHRNTCQGTRQVAPELETPTGPSLFSHRVLRLLLEEEEALAKAELVLVCLF